MVLLEQIFTIDKERINSFMGMTSEWEMAQIEKALKCSLALDRENIRNKIAIRHNFKINTGCI